MTALDSKSRFSSRVSDYAKYRPGYPLALLTHLAKECGLTPEAVIADIGSGTGLLSQYLLNNGNAVIGVEPNPAMREAAELFLVEQVHFRSLDGSAEATGLMSHTVDFIVAAQAFHWFDRAKTRQEWLRILKPGGWVVLIWNDRQVDSTPFLAAYEAILQEFGTDYNEINHKNVQNEPLLRAFFGADFQCAHFENGQRFDLDGLIGRAL
ncbi:MAG: methylase [Halothiobacillaceae bacterium]|nr:MAG: methylase [Halothiobacillaceae bacterium]